MNFNDLQSADDDSTTKLLSSLWTEHDVVYFFQKNPAKFTTDFLTGIAQTVVGKHANVVIFPSNLNENIEDNDCKPEGYIDYMDTSASTTHTTPSRYPSTSTDSTRTLTTPSEIVEVSPDDTKKHSDRPCVILTSSESNGERTSATNEIVYSSNDVPGNSFCLGFKGEPGLTRQYRSRRRYLFEIQKVKRGATCDRIVTDEWIQREIIDYIINHYKLQNLRVFRFTFSTDQNQKQFTEVVGNDIYKEIRSDFQKYTGSDSERKNGNKRKQSDCAINSSIEDAATNTSYHGAVPDNQEIPLSDKIAKYENIISTGSAPTINPAMMKVFDAMIKESSSLLGRNQLEDEETKTNVGLLIDHVWSICAGTCKDRINFTIQCPAHSNAEYLIEATPSLSIAEVKSYLYNNFHIPVEVQSLFYKGYELEDVNTLSSCEITQGSIVVLMLRKISGGGEKMTNTYHSHQGEEGDPHKSYSSTSINEFQNTTSIQGLNQNTMDENDAADDAAAFSKHLEEWENIPSDDDVNDDDDTVDDSDEDDDDDDEAGGANELFLRNNSERLRQMFFARLRAITVNNSKDSSKNVSYSVHISIVAALSNIGHNHFDRAETIKPASFPYLHSTEGLHGVPERNAVTGNAVISGNVKSNDCVEDEYEDNEELYEKKLRTMVLDEPNPIPSMIHPAHFETIDLDESLCTQGLQDEVMIAQAIDSGDIGELERCFENSERGRNTSPDVNGAKNITDQRNLNHDFARYLRRSVQKGQMDLIKYFLANQSSLVGIKDEDGKTPLHHAANCGHLEIVQFLLRDGNVDVDTQDKMGRTPLHEASITGKVDVIIRLLECGAQTDRRNFDGHTPLFFAVKYGQLSVAKALVEVGKSDVNLTSFSGTTPLHIAIRYKELQCVRYLLETCGAKIVKNFNGSIGLHIACTNGSVDIVKYLLQNKIVDVDDKNYEGTTALHISSNDGHLELVQTLIQDFEANVEAVTSDGSTALILACGAGHTTVCEYLLNVWPESASVADNMKRTPLHVASLHGRLEIVKLLVQRDQVDVSAIDCDGASALALAKLNGHTEIEHCLQSCLGILEEESIQNRTVDIQRNSNCYGGKTTAGSSGATNAPSLISSLVSSDSDSVKTVGTMTVAPTITKKQTIPANTKTRDEVMKYVSIFGSSPKTM
jgi:ankyrin repeat protein